MKGADVITVVRSQWSVEWGLFRALPRNARVLLGASTLYAFAAPVINVFISAFILRNSQDVVKVMVFQLALNTAVPLTFFLNGLFLRRFSPSVLYAFGLFLSGVSLAVMTSLVALDMTKLVLAGLMMGVASGFLWANRNLFALTYTHDACRNYFFGLENFVSCVSNVTVPAAVGAFIVWWSGADGLMFDSRVAYRLVAGAVVALALSASYVVLRGDFTPVPPPVFVRLRYDRVWCGMMALAALKGCVQLFQAVLPAMLIMRVLGAGENALGGVQSLGSLLAAVLLYLIGRNTRPEHRLAVLATALVVNLLGAGYHAVCFNAAAVLTYIVCFLISQPLQEVAYSPILLQVLDWATLREKGSAYAYLGGHELWLYAGRLAGACAFIWVARGISDRMALRYVLSVVAVLQMLSLPIARGMLKRMKAEGGRGTLC